jgi:cation diffusion facilitator CzcD-associated flavoprotein CzcO
MARSVRVVIVGGGVGGIAQAIALQRQGIDDVVILERSQSVGGTWQANTYPGLACDVPSHLYSFSFEPNSAWTRRFSPGPEIRAYVEDVARRHGVLEKVRMGAEVQRAAWDDEAGRWQIDLVDGGRYEADVLVSAVGQLSRPAIPAIPGLERFGGTIFHSAHWDHDTSLAGKRVAVVGTGASAIQFVPKVAEEATHVTVFQRSAPWVLSKPDREYPQRVRDLHARHPWLQRLWRNGWRLQMESLVPLFTGRPPRAAAALRKWYRFMSNANRFVQLRGDRRLYTATTPDYAMGCKRILITSDWFPALRRPNVELVTGGVREITEEGVVDAGGRLHCADAIVFGTGFASTRFLAPMEVHGRDGLSLDEAWAHGAEAYLGIAPKGFPNLFLIYGPNTNHGTGSIFTVHEGGTTYVAQAVRALADERAERLEVRPEVHDAFVAEMEERLKDSIWTACSSWYVTAEGRITNNWPGTHTEYLRRVKRLELGDYITTPVREPAEPSRA